MKKLMIAVAALTVGFAANAGSALWGGFVANEQEATQTAQAGAIFNAIFIGENDYSEVLSTFVYDTYTGFVGTGLGDKFVAAEGQVILDTHTLSATEAENWAFQSTAARADGKGGVNGNWLITMYDAATPDYFWVGQIAVSGADDSKGAVDATFGESWEIGYGMQEGVTSSQAVPEPTSGLLLLLGVAGLALKRRRA